MTTAQQQHISDPEAGALETAINEGMRRDGIQQTVCLHPDRTLTWDDELRMSRLECDYCPTVRVFAPGVHGPLPAWYFRG